jgi:hypothetical protein
MAAAVIATLQYTHACIKQQILQLNCVWTLVSRIEHYRELQHRIEPAGPDGAPPSFRCSAPMSVM